MKEHKKMYKAGKNWLVATICVTALGAAGAIAIGNQNVSADTVPNAAVQDDNSVGNVTMVDDAPKSIIYTDFETYGTGFEHYIYNGTFGVPVPVYPQYIYFQEDSINGINPTDVNDISVVVHYKFANGTTQDFKPKSGSTDWLHYNSDDETADIIGSKLFNSNGQSFSDLHENYKDSCIFKVNGISSENVNSVYWYTIMSIPVIRVNYTLNGQVIGTKYVSADGIQAGKNFSAQLTPPMGYHFDSSQNAKVTSNYTVSRDTDYYNNVNIATPANNVNNNDSKLQLSNVKDNQALLSGTFVELKTDNDNNNGKSYLSPDWIKNTISIPVTDGNPSKPNVPNQPNKPNVPNQPNKPNGPSQPSKPNGSSQPSKPNIPSRPNEPTPNTPVTPNVPDDDDDDTPYYISSATDSINDSSTASSSSISSSAAPSAVNNDRKMYNHKTQLVKKHGHIEIWIQPKYASNSANGSLADKNVVTRKLANGKIVHTQLVTLKQYNSMLLASGKHSFTEQTLRETYRKRHSLKGIMRDNINKTTFDAKTVQNGSDVLIDTTGVNNGFNQPTDKQMVKDTDNIRVKVHRNHHKK